MLSPREKRPEAISSTVSFSSADKQFNSTDDPVGMLGIAGYTRRNVLRLGASALHRVAGSVSLDAATWDYRQYAVHATVMLGSVPLFKRNVGGAAFASPTQNQIFTVARGRATIAGCTFLLQHRTLDAKVRWTNCGELLAGLDATTALLPAARVANYRPGCLPTFLFAVHKVYGLRLHSKLDGNSGLTLETDSSTGERALPQLLKKHEIIA